MCRLWWDNGCHGKFSVGSRCSGLVANSRVPHSKAQLWSCADILTPLQWRKLVWDMQRSPHALRRWEGHYPQPWGDTIFCENPTIHCRYSATIPRFTADTLWQSHNSLPILCDNPTIYCRYSATIPRFTADTLRQSHDSLPIFRDSRFQTAVVSFTILIPNSQPRQANCNVLFRLRFWALCWPSSCRFMPLFAWSFWQHYDIA